jgi:DNA-binding transcriptional regulator of glucitol operon
MRAPRWWLLHVAVLAIVFAMLRLGLWQWHRAESGNGGIQNYAYAFQWPVFAVFGIVLWIRTMIEESRRDPDAPTTPVPGRPGVTPDASIIRHPGVRVGLTTPVVADDEDDPEVAARNAALARMNAATLAAHGRTPQSRRR